MLLFMLLTGGTKVAVLGTELSKVPWVSTRFALLLLYIFVLVIIYACLFFSSCLYLSLSYSIYVLLFFVSLFFLSR